MCDKLRTLFASYFQALIDNDRLFTDEFIHGQAQGFKDCRHDQSILSVLRKMQGTIALPDETWFVPFGNEESLKHPFWATRHRE